MEHLAFVIDKSDTESVLLITDRDMQESAARLGIKEALIDESFGIGRVFAAGLFAADRVFVVQRAAGKLLEASGMHAVVLPVTVAAEAHHIFHLVFREPREEAVCLVFESACVGVIVLLAVAVGTDHGRGRDDDFPGGITFPESALQPFTLLRAPYGFVRTVGHRIRGAVVAALDEPELEVPVHPVGAIGRGGRVTAAMDRHLLAEDLAAGRCVGKFLSGEVGVVEAEIVIVLRPVGGSHGEEVDF